MWESRSQITSTWWSLNGFIMHYSFQKGIFRHSTLFDIPFPRTSFDHLQQPLRSMVGYFSTRRAPIKDRRFSYTCEREFQRSEGLFGYWHLGPYIKIVKQILAIVHSHEIIFSGNASPRILIFEFNHAFNENLSDVIGFINNGEIFKTHHGTESILFPYLLWRSLPRVIRLFPMQQIKNIDFPNFSIESLWELSNFKPNPNQDKAIRHVNGPLFLPAGPGSTKTRVLLWWALNLIVFTMSIRKKFSFPLLPKKLLFNSRKGFNLF